MKTRMNKKGFTITELVIVIVVIAILAAVLIPTFISLVRKANISNDTVVTKNLNTVAISEQADTFDEALAIAKDAGYLVANLNAKADGCFFVWEDDTNQFLLYDLKEKKIIYSNSAVEGDPDESWHFAVNNSKDEAALTKEWPDVTVKLLVVNAKDLADILSLGGDVYFDESIVLNNKNLLVFDAGSDKTTNVNLEDSSLNTSGIIRASKNDNDLSIPIQVKTGKVNFNGGNIAVAGEAQNLDNRTVKIVLRTEAGTEVTFDGTTFDSSNFNGQMKINGKLTMNDVTIKATKVGVDTQTSGQVILNTTTINMVKGTASDAYGSWVWACNGHKAENKASIVINSGTYTRENIGGSYAGIVACGGEVVINGGTFTAEDNLYFSFCGTNGGKIVINGGTFGGKTLTTVDEVAAFCAGTYNIEKTASGFVITQ